MAPNNLLPLSLLDAARARVNIPSHSSQIRFLARPTPTPHKDVNTRSLSQLQLKTSDDLHQEAPSKIRSKHVELHKLHRPKSDADVVGESSRTLPPSTTGRSRKGVAVYSPRAVRTAAELQARVVALVADSAYQYEPSESSTYSEEELRNVYMDLLAHDDQALTDAEHVDTEMTREDVETILHGMAQRLLESEDAQLVDGNTGVGSGRMFSRRMRARLAAVGQPEGSSSDMSALQERIPEQEEHGPLHRRILAPLEAIVAKIEGVKIHVSSSQDGLETPSRKGKSPADLPIAILSNSEWKALIYRCIEEGDSRMSMHTLGLMKRAGLQPPDDLMSTVLKSFADKGEVSQVETFIAQFSDDKPTEMQRDLHVKSHLMSTSPLHNVTTALTVLHNYESLAIPPPAKTYTRLIVTLLHCGSTQLQAQGWDLFAHMRYVAHPDPDVFLYSTMIRACAGTGPTQKAYSTEPERALDLWTEMTVDRKLRPTVQAYNAIILACARSKKYATEAFRLAKEMLNAQRDAFGNPAMRPDAHTFNALLVAAKGMADLGRTRWILAEMLNYMRESPKEAPWPSASHMRHIFHAYSAYRPPFRRNMTTIVDEQDVLPEQPAADNSTLAIGLPPKPRSLFTHIPPQSHGEVVAEADALFHRILEDNGIDSSSGEFSEDLAALTSGKPFSKVRITEPLINSYISVYYNHAHLMEARRLYDGLHNKLGLERSLRAYVDALTRCAYPTHAEIADAEAFSDYVWQQWCFTITTRDRLPKDITPARSIEQAYAARIRLLAFTNRLDDALSLLRTFASKYPPKSVKKPAPKLGIRSTRTVLFAPKPLVRLVSSTDVPDDTVPPLLTFSDLEILHHRLLVSGRMSDIAYIKWICKTYEGALRKRREQSIRSKKLID